MTTTGESSNTVSVSGSSASASRSGRGRKGRRPTQHVHTTSTASVEGSVHDAAMCDRIRELEERVRELEHGKHCYHHWGCGHWHYYPQWTWTSTGSPYTKTLDTNSTTVTTWQTS